MDAVLRAAAIYGFLLVIFRVTGRRTLAQITTFDLVLLLIIGEATQQALLGDDFSVTNALIVITTLVAIDVALSLAQHYSRTFDKLIDGVPLVIVEDGKPLDDRMHKARVDITEVLEQARATQGLERLDQIKYAVLERSGTISIVPK
jgi:uncharacterized membrane protein YcaP (DUF421 family)